MWREWRKVWKVWRGADGLRRDAEGGVEGEVTGGDNYRELSTRSGAQTTMILITWSPGGGGRAERRNPPRATPVAGV